MLTRPVPSTNAMSSPRDPIDEGVEDPSDRPIEPGTPRPEHVAFVVFGAVLTILVFLRGLGVL